MMSGVTIVQHRKGACQALIITVNTDRAGHQKYETIHSEMGLEYEELKLSVLG